MKKFGVGIQLYGVRNALQADFEGTLAAVKELGYEYVEFAGYYGGKTGEEIKEILEHLEAAEEIIERAQAYNQELREFSAECERVNRASFTGEYRPMTVGSMPTPLSDGIKELLYHYRRMSQ